MSSKLLFTVPELLTLICTKCKIEKDVSEFYSDKFAKNGHSQRCKKCISLRMAEYYAIHKNSNTSPEFKLVKRKYRLFVNYHLTLEQWNAILALQGGCCAICSTKEPGGRGEWYVDHDHGCCQGFKSCGMCIRGLLCNKCNLGRGLFNDNPELLEKAAAYSRNSHIVLSALK